MSTPHADDLLGQTIGSYVIVARVGGGGMGVVYQARDTKLGRTVALKFLPPQWSHDEDARQRFVREAQAASATNHPNICTIHDISTAPDGQLFIVMAYYDGQTLKQRLASGPLPVEEALDIATQIADGLARAHAQGVVHRDVKPGNVILTEDGVRIVDFGLATFSDALKLTVEHSTLGTAAYMSPEQVRGQSADARSDVWSVGVILYEMLTGHVPFQGSHAEAIAYAVRNETPAPIRTSRPEMGEEIEQLVFRALHKEPSVRFKDGRELARALRQGRGQSLPLDLRTEPLSLIDVRPADRRPRLSLRRPLVLACGAIVGLAVASGAWWLLSPAERVFVVVSPVVDQTGRPEVSPYRLALTQSLITRLSESRDVRPVSYRRLLQTLRRFSGDSSREVFSRDAVQAVASDTGAALIIIPTLLYEGNAWRARVEFRSPAATNVETRETASFVSAISKEAVYELVSSAAALVEDRFKSRQSRVINAVRGVIGAPRSASVTYLRTMDAADAFEKGISAYEVLEYSTALQAFHTAAERDTRHPLPAAWESRLASLLGRSDAAIEAADRALTLVTSGTSTSDAIFVRAIAAEARRQVDEAEKQYRELIATFPDEPSWILELAAFQDRLGRTADAVTSYHAALGRDARLVRPQVELCRLYNSTRMNESSLARKHGDLARTAYVDLGDSLGEAQALLCLADILRIGDASQRAEARQHAEGALAIFERERAPYNLGRAFHYVALTRARNEPAQAIVAWEKALTAAEQVGNTALAAGVLTNLGAAHEDVGNWTRSIDYYRRSALTSEARGDQRGAAYNQALAGALLIRYGLDPDAGLREVENALAVIQKIEDKNFEVFCRRMIARYRRQTGQREAAARELRLAEEIAKELALDQDIATLTVELAQLRLDASDYEGAKEAFLKALDKEIGTERVEAHIGLGRVQTLLGDFEAAGAALAEAEREIDLRGDNKSRPLLHAARGLLAYESGRLQEARAEFVRARAYSSAEFADEASVEAQAYEGLLDALDGRLPVGRTAVQKSLDEARKLKRVALEARSSVHLARILLRERRPREAVTALSQISVEMLGLELRVLVHHWRAEALDASGDLPAGQRESEMASKSLMELKGPLSDAGRFERRAEIRAVLE